MKNLNLKKQNGFSILAIILVIVAIIAAIAVWSMSGSGANADGSTNTAKLHASAIMNDLQGYKMAYSKLIIDGSSKASITFVPNTAGSSNMLDPTNGVAYSKPNANAIHASFVDPDGIYVYNKNGFVPSYSNTQHPVIFLAGVKDSVCQQINNTLYGSTNIPKYAPFTNSNQFVAGATATAPTSTTSVDFPSGSLPVGGSTDGWKTGCVSANATTDQNLVFQILD